MASKLIWSSFPGIYEPPECDFDTVRIKLTVTSKGRQFDRLGLMFLGDTEVFRTSTAEPTASGILWTYVKEVSQYISLWKQPQKLIFDLGNLVNDIYTGSFSVILKAHFSYENNVQTPNVILPISARKSASNSSSAFSLPSDKAAVRYKIPAAASRAVVSISACGQSEEEFWWSNVLSSDTNTFRSTVGPLYGYSPFREVQLYIDGTIAGVVWPFPIIFTGGVAPGFWRPIVGIDAFDLRQPEIDISPFLPVLTDGQEHLFEIRAVGLNVSSDGTATLSDSVGSYWVVTGTVFLYLDKDSAPNHPSQAITVDAPAPRFEVTRDLIQNEAGVNESLSYSVTAQRILKISSSGFSWSQNLTYSNVGLLWEEGISQVNTQITTGENLAQHGANGEQSKVSFHYPLRVNTTYRTVGGTTTIHATMQRGLHFSAFGLPGISTYTLASRPSWLYTTQSGEAFQQTTGTYSDTIDDFESFANGERYHRHVRAANGSVIEINGLPQGYTPRVVSQGPGRDSIRSILGRGPSELLLG